MYNSIVNPGDVLVFNITAATNTKIQVKNSTIFTIYVNNTMPEYLYYPLAITAKSQFPTTIDIIYGAMVIFYLDNSSRMILG